MVGPQARSRPGPIGGVRDRNRAKQQQRLADAGLALFLAHGTEAVTIDEIAARAKMAKGSFYRYAAGKPALVAQIVESVAEHVIAALDRCEQALHTARVEALDGVYIQLALELSAIVAGQPKRVLMYLQEVRAPRGPARVAIHAFSDELTARAIRLTEVAHRHALIRDVDPRVAAITVLGAVDALLFTHLRASKTMAMANVGTVTAELVGIVVRGIGRAR